MSMNTTNHLLHTITLTDHLDHDWTDELVGYPVDARSATVLDEQGRNLLCQLADGKVWFIVDRLPALGEQQFRIVADDTPATTTAATASSDGNTLILSNGVLSLRVPCALGEEIPAPILGVRLGDGPWLGQGTLRVHADAVPDAIAIEATETGPLWTRWRLSYTRAGQPVYVVSLRLFAGKTFVEVIEDAYFNHAAAWDFDLRSGLSPDLGFTHAHGNWMESPARVRRLDGEPLGNLGAITLPNYGGIYVPDDYVFYTLARTGGVRVSVSGIHGGSWLYPAENQVEINHTAAMTAFNFPCKAGHREWCLAVEPHDDAWETRWFETLAQRVVRRYGTTLDWAKEMTLVWDDGPTARPSLTATAEQLPVLREKSRRISSLRAYLERLDPALDGECFRYHANTWGNQDPDSPADPPSAYLFTGDRLAARRTAEMILAGVRHRLQSFLSPTGNLNDAGGAFINLGRGLRPWVQFYDLIAADGVLTPEEERWFRAACSFLGYKIADRDYFPAEALLYHSDHPRSAHRTHWFPNRESDYNYHNIDNLPHNFHQELYVTQIALALTFPGHPEHGAWLAAGVEMLDKELTEFVFPCGSWIESATYTFGAMSHLFVPTMHLLKQAGVCDFFADQRFQNLFRFLARLITPPDPRCGHGVFPVLGDASFPGGYASVFNWVATLSEDIAPQFAAEMQHAWERYGSLISPRACQGLNYLDILFVNDWISPVAPAPFTSEHLTDLGAVLRNRQGQPDETMLVMKCGKIYSHFHGDEGSFLLTAKGVPLMDEYGVQYCATGGEARRHNIVEFAGRECYNRGRITRFQSTPYADYLIAEMPIHVLYIPPGLNQWGFKGEEGPFGWWRRHVLYARDDDFFMIYDEIASPYTTTSHLHCKADSYTRRDNCFHFDGRYGVDLEVLLLSERELPVEMLEWCPAERNPGQPVEESWFTQWSINYSAGPDEPYACVLYPHLPDVPVTLDGLDNTGVRAHTTDGPTLAFLAPTTITHAADGYHYDGCAGLIRDRAAGVELMQLRGRHIGVGEVDIEGDGPFTALVTAETITISALDPTHYLKVAAAGRQLRWAGRTRALPDGRWLLRV